MVPFASYNEMESLGFQLATEYMKKAGKSRVKCFDITGFITDFLHFCNFILHVSARSRPTRA